MRVALFLAVNLALTVLLPVGLEVRQQLRPDGERLIAPRGADIYRMLAVIRQRVPPDELMLVFRPAEMGYYSRQRIILADDPRMARVLAAPTAQRAADLLHAQGVRWVLDPGLPYYYQLTRTSMASLVADASLSELVHSAGAVRLYRLK